MNLQNAKYICHVYQPPNHREHDGLRNSHRTKIQAKNCYLLYMVCLLALMKLLQPTHDISNIKTTKKKSIYAGIYERGMFKV